MTAKTISCVIPCRNGADTLNSALMSVVTQIKPPLEVIVLDNCSTDGTADIVRRYMEQYSFVKLVQYPVESDNWKRDAALNSLALTTGDYIHNLSSNDYLEQGLLYEAAQSVQNAGLIFAEFMVKMSNGQVGISTCDMLPGNREYPREMLQKQLSRSQFFEGGPCGLLRRDVLQWLAAHRFWEMETWNDSLGYSAAAWFFGASYIPFPCGTFTLDVNGDGERRKGDIHCAGPMYAAVVRFLDNVSREKINGVWLPDELRYALQLKIYNMFPRPYRYMEMIGSPWPPQEAAQPSTTTVELSVAPVRATDSDSSGALIRAPEAGPAFNGAETLASEAATICSISADG